MGEVWKARDTRLDRILAVKRLNGQHSARFELEAGRIDMVVYHTLCSEFDAAADCYKKAIEQCDVFGVLIVCAGLLKPLCESPRWPELAKMMNLPEALES